MSAKFPRGGGGGGGSKPILSHPSINCKAENIHPKSEMSQILKKISFFSGPLKDNPQAMEIMEAWKITNKSSMHGKIMEFEKT